MGREWKGPSEIGILGGSTSLKSFILRISSTSEVMVWFISIFVVRKGMEYVLMVAFGGVFIIIMIST